MSQSYELTTITIRKGLEQNRNNITPEEAELLYIIDTKGLYIGDGTTVGGHKVGGGTISIGDVELSITAGNGLIGGGPFIDGENIIQLGIPNTILDGTTINSVSSSSHTHEIDATDRRDITNHRQLLLAKALKDHIDNENHSGSSTIPEHDTLIGYNPNHHIDHNFLNITSGDGLSGGGNLLISRTIHMRTPLILDGESTSFANNTGHSHKIEVSFEKTINDNKTLLLAKGLYKHLQEDPHISLTHNHNHNELNQYISGQHINHESLELIAGNGLDGGGNLTTSRTIILGTPSAISGTTTNSTTSVSHTHRILATASRNITNDHELLLAKAMKDHIQFEQHGSGTGTDHNHDHNLLTNYEVNRHINHATLSVIGENGLSGGGVLTSSQAISLIMPGNLNGLTINDNTNNHTHKIDVTDQRDVTNNHELLLAKAMKDHIDNEEHVIPDGSNHNHDHNSLINFEENKHINHESISIVGSSGLSGGGNLTNSHYITLNMPGDLSGETVNDNSNNHTHRILATNSRNVTNTNELLLAKALKEHIDIEPHIDVLHNHNHDNLNGVVIGEHIDHELISIVGTGALGGGGDLTLSRTINMKMPGDLSGTTVNSNSGNHTHQILATDSRTITDNNHLLLAKALKFHLDNDPHASFDGTDHTHHHNLLDGYVLNNHIDHSEIAIIAGDGLSGGGFLTQTISIQLKSPQDISGITINEITDLGHTHKLLVTNQRDVSTADYILLASAMKDHIDNEEHVIPDGSNHTHDHDSLFNVDDNKHINHSIISVIGGSGLTGTGTIDNDIILNLGTPSIINGETNNIVDETSHTHELEVVDSPIDNPTSLLLARGLFLHLINDDHTDHESISIYPGPGLKGGGNLSNSFEISLGIPSDINGLTLNEHLIIPIDPPHFENSHTHKIECSEDPLNNDTTLLLSKGLYNHITSNNHSRKFSIIQLINTGTTYSILFSDLETGYSPDINMLSIDVYIQDGIKWTKDHNKLIISKSNTTIEIQNVDTVDLNINIIIRD